MVRSFEVAQIENHGQQLWVYMALFSRHKGESNKEKTTNSSEVHNITQSGNTMTPTRAGETTKRKWTNQTTTI